MSRAHRVVSPHKMCIRDRIRTDLEHPWEDGTSSLYFDKIRFAYFDCMILQREGAEKDYTDLELQQVRELDKTITEAEKNELVDTLSLIHIFKP